MCQGDPQSVASGRGNYQNYLQGNPRCRDVGCQAAEKCFLLAVFVAMLQKPNNSKLLLAVQQSTS